MMNRKVIFVNATSVTIGGSLTILKQFIKNIFLYKEQGEIYYIFVPINSDYKDTGYVKFIKIKGKKYIDRLKWDIYGMKQWSKKKDIFPDLIISLQNTGVFFNNIKQIIYLHQSLPYAEESRWNIFKKDERKMWFYRNIYNIWIDKTIKPDYFIVVQTHWMKQVLINRGYLGTNIIISKPDVDEIKVEDIKSLKKEKDFCFFYPAADYKYKNHNVIIEAINKLYCSNKNLEKKIQIIFTLEKKSYLYERVVELGLEKIIKFVGQIPYNEVLRYYKSCDVVLFPSYIETFGLPLIEASKFNKKILVSNCSYSREVLENYNNAIYIDYKDIYEWSININNAINNANNNVKESIHIKKSSNGWDSTFELINRLV
ncbi:glycosyltransferase family 4 protein [Clostridium botulinum]|nr:glycosyltransferase family 4 protein [Clostridium botulinum]